jgi:hypothetical protein
VSLVIRMKAGRLKVSGRDIRHWPSILRRAHRKNYRATVHVGPLALTLFNGSLKETN